MKKLIYLLLLFIFVFLLLSGCSLGNEYQIKKAVRNYYKKINSAADAKVIGIKLSNMENLSLAEYSKKGKEPVLDLLMINKDSQGYFVFKSASGLKPSYTDTILNKVNYDNNTVIFGTFKDKNEKYTGVSISYSDGKKFTANIKKRQGFIIICNTLSSIKNVTLYDSKKNETPLANPFINETKFLIVRNQ